MFDMFRGGRPDPITLMVVDYEEKRERADKAIAFIKKNYTCGEIDLDDLYAELGCSNPTEEEVEYIKKKLTSR